MHRCKNKEACLVTDTLQPEYRKGTFLGSMTTLEPNPVQTDATALIEQRVVVPLRKLAMGSGMRVLDLCHLHHFSLVLFWGFALRKAREPWPFSVLELIQVAEVAPCHWSKCFGRSGNGLVWGAMKSGNVAVGSVQHSRLRAVSLQLKKDRSV